MDDPQKWFSVTVLLINFLCFLIISLCYIFIHLQTKSSSHNLSANAQLQQRNRRLQTKISIIILTDFLCWIPFMTVCLLHFGGILDASSWYPIFSTIILPINSVINPLLYNNSITNVLRACLVNFYRYAVSIINALWEVLRSDINPPTRSDSSTTQSIEAEAHHLLEEEIEMRNLSQHEN